MHILSFCYFTRNPLQFVWWEKVYISEWVSVKQMKVTSQQRNSPLVWGCSKDKLGLAVSSWSTRKTHDPCVTKRFGTDCLPPLNRWYEGCFGAALQKAAFESLEKVGSTFGWRTEAAWDKTVRQKKLDWRHIVWEKAKHSLPYYFGYLTNEFLAFREMLYYCWLYDASCLATAKRCPVEAALGSHHKSGSMLLLVHLATAPFLPWEAPMVEKMVKSVSLQQEGLGSWARTLRDAGN